MFAYYHEKENNNITPESLNKNINLSCVDTSHIEIFEKHSSIIWRFIILKPIVVTIYKHSKNSLHITGVKSRESVNQIISFNMTK